MKPTDKKKKVENRRGRPTVYTLDFIVKEVNNIWETLISDEKLIFNERTGQEEIKRFRYVTLQQIIKKRPYSKQRYYEWKAKYKDNQELADLYKKIDEELEDRLIMLGLTGKGGNMAIFALKNRYGWKNENETNITLTEPVTQIVIEKPQEIIERDKKAEQNKMSQPGRQNETK